ncbi:hypothetical protein FOA43_003261 [Brettanomyces nanus]|uniref:GPI inositol-deacylase n=1 Tax=Eeniella nana TaxID=13502 RepID=A0A875S6C9_EENNA|nr:uncharacterized protein FOA43_003261 [Brettanomyces nanus]QPG75875.1 hypothetical protein FOA43_003261 [Brettanomyces nanus]
MRGEQNKDPLPRNKDDDDDDENNRSLHLTGTPVLFIPGNAGSYKQVRSIAAEAASVFYDQKERIKRLNSNVTSLDFFSADFNGDFTAFHGQTMMDQSEYLNDAVKFILSLYQDNPTPARSVILLAHSMGGIVARVMLSLPNHLEGSVNTILTLAAPHSAPPATFDGKLLRVFKKTDDFWRNEFSKSGGRLENVTIVSITGGILDNMLPADYTTLTGLVPETNGLAVTTTGIPGVWTPIDHLAIVWCDQLRRVVAQSLLEVTDRSMIGYSIEHRMDIFRRNFVTGVSADSLASSSKTFGLKIDVNRLSHSMRERSFQFPNIRKKRDSASPGIHMFHVPRDDQSHAKFSYISSLKPTPIEELSVGSAPAILLCRTVPAAAINSGKFAAVLDYTSDSTSQFVQLECVDLHNSVQMIPRSYPGTASMEASSLGGSEQPFYSLELSPEYLEGFSSVVIVESGIIIDSKDFVLADMELQESSQVSLGEASLWKLLSRGYDLTLPSHRPLVVDIDVPCARSSLLTYNFDIRYQKSSSERFSPLIRQKIGDEVKWHIDLAHNPNVVSRTMGVPPFCPYKKSSHLQLKLYADTFASDQIMDIYLSVDWFKSLRNLVLRYRLSIVGLPVFVTCLVLFLQLAAYIDYGYYPSFGEGLLKFCSRKIMGPLVLIFCILPSFTSHSFFKRLFGWLDPIPTANEQLFQKIGGSDVRNNEYFLGIGEGALWFLGPLSLVIATSSVGTLHLIVSSICQLVVFVSKKLSFVFHGVPIYTGSVAGNRRRTIAVILLMTLVLVYLPYQFAFVVCFFTQSFVVLKSCIQSASSQAVKQNSPQKSEKVTSTALLSSSSSSSSSSTTSFSLLPPSASSLSSSSTTVPCHRVLKSFDNYKNFNFSLLLLMTWILPINIPILMVWVHNFSLKWATPFSSHHNFLAVLPIVLLVQLGNAGYMFSKPSWKISVIGTKLLVAYVAIYALMFSTRHLFWLHHLFNLMCSWFLVLILEDRFLGKLNHYTTPDKAVTTTSKLH